MKKDIILKFTPLSEFLAKQMKNKRFREAYTEEMSRLNLAYELRSLRQKKGMTQGEVALKAKMPQSVVARIESGSRGFSIATLYKIAKVFGRDIGLIASRR